MQVLSDPLITLADGTVKQVSPLSGTQVWTVPGRGSRPLGTKHTDPQPLSEGDFGSRDPFGWNNLLQAPPEKARVVLDESVFGGYSTMIGVLPDQLFDTIAEFRRVPNLFEIVSYDYRSENYGFEPDRETQQRMEAYLDDLKGREHVLNIIHTCYRAAGRSEEEISVSSNEELLRHAPSYFADGHDVIIARRHFIDGATHDNQLASSGTLSVAEHHAFIAFTVGSTVDLYRRNRYVRYVAAFQNWPKLAGASFDHLHKRLVAVDGHGEQLKHEVQTMRKNPNIYNEHAVDYAVRHNLIIAEDEHAVVFAGFGHHYPTLEIFSKSDVYEPWPQTRAEIDAMSDPIHACHAATGPTTPCNEEWHHRPVDLDTRMLWRAMIKWRTSNSAGFKGGTKIYLNTISPWDLRDRVVPEIYHLRGIGKISDNIHIATECQYQSNSLKYNPFVEDRSQL